MVEFHFTFLNGNLPGRFWSQVEFFALFSQLCIWQILTEWHVLLRSALAEIDQMILNIYESYAFIFRSAYTEIFPSVPDDAMKAGLLLALSIFPCHIQHD